MRAPGVDSPWYAFYTRARHERRVEERLQHRGFESFVPRIPLQRQWKDRKKIVDWPLFPGYVFARCTVQEVGKVASTTGIVSVVSNNGKPAPVDADELLNVRWLVQVLTLTGGVPERIPLDP